MSDSFTIDCTIAYTLPNIPPTTRSLHLLFPICIYEDSSENDFFFDGNGHTRILDDLLHLLENAPSVEEIHISLSNKVVLAYVEKNGIHTGYDKYGALYEDYEWNIQTEELTPSHCLSLQNPKEYGALKEKLQQVSAFRKWSCFEVPDYYPQGNATEEEVNALYDKLYELR
jgi:hypothetical protein